MDLLRDKISERYEQVLEICERWFKVHSLELIEKHDFLFIVNNEKRETYVARDIIEVMDYVARLIKNAIKKAEALGKDDCKEYRDIVKEYKLLTTYEYHKE